MSNQGCGVFFREDIINILEVALPPNDRGLSSSKKLFTALFLPVSIVFIFKKFEESPD
jgi:hypothetical protein